MKKYLVAGLLLISVLSACTYSNEETLYPNDVCDTTNVTYSNDILPVFQQNCYVCHHGTTLYGNLDLADFDHIQRVVDSGELLKNIKHEPDGTPMPQGGGKLPDCTILKIENWIDQGIPQN